MSDLSSSGKQEGAKRNDSLWSSDSVFLLQSLRISQAAFSTPAPTATSSLDSMGLMTGSPTQHGSASTQRHFISTFSTVDTGSLPVDISTTSLAHTTTPTSSAVLTKLMSTSTTSTAVVTKSMISPTSAYSATAAPVSTASSNGATTETEVDETVTDAEDICQVTFSTTNVNQLWLRINKLSDRIHWMLTHRFLYDHMIRQGRYRHRGERLLRKVCDLIQNPGSGGMVLIDLQTMAHRLMDLLDIYYSCI